MESPSTSVIDGLWARSRLRAPGTDLQQTNEMIVVGSLDSVVYRSQYSADLKDSARHTRVRKPSVDASELLVDRASWWMRRAFGLVGRTDMNMDLVNDLITIEQGGSLLQTQALRLNNEEVTEHQLDGEPAAVNDLR
jgi:hypothetical protein